jgi:hypothetical protein
MYKFAAASENETIVFGAARLGYSNNEVEEVFPTKPRSRQ